MITLIIETSTEKSLIAIAQEDSLIYHQFLPEGMQSSRFLMSEIQKGLETLNLSFSKISALAVGVGPGSYTGIRVGAAAAKGLSFPRALPLIALSSLEGFILDMTGKFISLIDARIGGYYALFQERHDQTVTPIGQPQLISKEELIDILKDCPHQVGPHTSYPNPHHLASISYKKYLQNEFSKDLNLIYLRNHTY